MRNSAKKENLILIIKQLMKALVIILNRKQFIKMAVARTPRK